MNYNTTLAEAILHIEKAIPDQICDSAIEIVNANPWQLGSWYNYSSNDYKENTHSTSQKVGHYKLFCDIIAQWQEKYNNEIHGQTFCTRRTRPTVNKYEVGEYMDRHHDHIHSLFDGQQKGIPIMTTLGVLNDDFEGGNFVMWDDYDIPLKKGDILAFPSVYLFPHRVEKVTSGTRYSWISWWF